MKKLIISRFLKQSGLILGGVLILSSCYDPTQKADSDHLKVNNTGTEYAPQMYNAEAYEPMSQITDTTAGLEYWPFKPVGDGHGEWYNTNHYNPYNMNMRQPHENTVMYGRMLPYSIPEDSLALADKNESPFKIETELKVEEGDTTEVLTKKGEAQLEEAKQLYLSYCSHCHGEKGNADGKVGKKYGGVPNYSSQRVKGHSEGRIFHVITYGWNSMRPHASLLSQMERWKIARYVKELQKED